MVIGSSKLNNTFVVRNSHRQGRIRDDVNQQGSSTQRMSWPFDDYINLMEPGGF